MICAIMQPTYLPWAGYFNLIASVEYFVFLDDVQFEKQSWQSRNRILLDGKEHLLSLDIKRTPKNTVIKNIYMNEKQNWQIKHWKTLKSAYKKARYSDEVFSILAPIYTSEIQLSLSEFNQHIIKKISHLLGLNVNFLRASDLSCHGKRSQHLLEICAKMDCDQYLSPIGSKEYLLADKFEDQTSVRLFFQNYTPAAYPQYKSDTFVSHLSIIDVIANIGIQDTKKYILNKS